MNVSATTKKMDTNIQRLSSGLKISSSGDNPSGMIESSQLAKQIAGIGQAISNSQDAANLSKTADSGLSQIESILQNIRTVAVSAANNATTTPTSLQADQSQINSAIQAIDGIANSTEWGNVQLLNGTAGVKSSISDTSDVVGMFVGSTIGGMAPANGAVTVTLTQQASQTYLTANQPFTGTNAIVPAGSFSVNGTSFSADGSTQTVQDVINEVNNSSGSTGVVATAVGSAGNTYIQFRSANYGSNYPVNFYDSGHVLDTSTTPPPTAAGTDAVASVTVPVSTAIGPSTTTVNFTGGLGPTHSGLELMDSSGNIVTLTASGNNGTNLTSGAGIGQLTTGTVHFQTGQGTGQAVTYTMPNAQADQLGTSAISGQNLSTIDLTSQSGATQALSVIDAAIDQVSTMRGNLGAFQSGLLQPNISVLSIATQNLTSTQSSIQDTDVAAEMTSYTQNQVLQQSGIAILAQANLDPQKLLQLLQKS
jgi:flagellin